MPTNYEAKHITVLEGLEPVRKRPGMYIGSTGVSGLHHLVWEVMDNAIDEAMAGYCDQIWVIVHPENMVEVVDNGRGIPVDIHPKTKKSALETVLTILHAGGKFGEGGYKVSGGLHGVGVSVVNALSEWMRAEVARGGKIHAQEYKRGKPQGKVKVDRSISGRTKKGEVPFPIPGSKTGTRIIFKPDPQVLETLEFNINTILDHCRQQAYLTKGVNIKVIDKRGKPDFKYNFYFEGGIASYVKHLNENKEALNDRPIYIEKQVDDSKIEIAIQYNDGFTENIFSFANNIFTSEGGMHMTGFRSSLTRAINDYAKKSELIKNGDSGLSGDDTREGLTAIVSIKLKNPQFEGQTKAKLGNPEAKNLVENVACEGIKNYLEENPAYAKKIIEKCLLSARARMAAKAARDTVIRKGALEGMTLPGKLADCSEKKAEKCEIYIVEGDSAGGSAKQARDRGFQAILPLRGKILNVERARLDKTLSSQEIKSLIIALGAGIGETFNVEKLRYHRIIIMTDADVDGAHIETLLLTFFFRFMPDVIKNGYLYIAQPPLYKIQSGKEKHYVFTDEEKDELIEEIQKSKKKSGEEGEKTKGVSIQRYKGLGEMNPEQLWDTTMDPQNRVILRVDMDDASVADQIFDTLMGAQVLPRKRFIQTHAKNVKNLDI